MEPGDLFYLHVLDETSAYQVDQIKVVLPGETEDLQIGNIHDIELEQQSHNAEIRQYADNNPQHEHHYQCITGKLLRQRNITAVSYTHLLKVAEIGPPSPKSVE